MAAELIGGALLSAFLDPLVEKLASEVKDFFKGKEAILKLVKELNTTLSSAGLLLIDAEEKLIKDQRVKKWLDDLKDTIYAANDLVYKIDTEALRDKLEISESQSGCTCCNKVLMKLIPTPLTPFDKTIKSEIGEILGKLKLLLENKDLGLKRIEKEKHPERVCAPLVEESDVYGRDDDRKTILNLLLSDDMSVDKFSVIPIVGMGGMGKTTLAQLVYNDEGVNQKFDTKVWITVGDESKLDKVTKKIVQKVDPSAKCEIEEQYELLDKVKRDLAGKKFLVVLDDVWDEDRNRWEVLKSCFTSVLHGSKIIVTTRSDIVASIMETEPTHYLQRISFDKGWELFAKFASIHDVNSFEYSDLEVIGRKIVDKCKGLPLAIKLLGGLLRGKKNREDWNDILNNDIWELYERSSVGILPTLWLSYFYLPSHLKPCFAYCAMFPKDYEYKKEDMMLLWMAEGFLHPKQAKPIEKVGEEYFQDLISRSFFQPSSSEDASTFLMHDLIHDLAMFVSGEFCLAVNDTKISKCTSKVRHLSFRQEGQVVGPMKFEDLSITKGLCTFLLLWKRGHYPYSVEHLLELLLSTRGCLRVLSIADGYMTKLPNSIGKLKYLKFLELDFWMIKEIPSTICDLYNLETLLLERCYSVTRLPNNIGNLVKLRHFCIPFVLVEMPLQFGLMKNLQTLNKFVVGKNKNSGIKLLKEFQDLHGTLTIWGLENIGSVEDVLEANLKNKKFLKLHFKWDDRHEHGDLEREKEILGALEAHENLKEFNVHGYKGSSFPSWIGDHLFSNLTMVKLQDCKNCIFLPSLGQLPALKDLSIQHFYSVVRIDSEFYHSVASAGSSAANTKPFRSLERLSFENMTELQEWSFIEGGVFPRLKFLDFFNCKRLKVSLLPHYFPSLRELVIDTCEKLMPLLKTSADPLMDSSFPSLEILQISRCDGQELLLEGGLPSSLKDFVIHSCKNLVAIDNECFQHLNSLENLQIGECSQLRRWPNELPTSLSDLVIFGCKLLKPRLQRDISNNINVTILEYEHDTTKDDLHTSSRCIRLGIPRIRTIN